MRTRTTMYYIVQCVYKIIDQYKQTCYTITHSTACMQTHYVKNVRRIAQECQSYILYFASRYAVFIESVSVSLAQGAYCFSNKAAYSNNVFTFYTTSPYLAVSIRAYVCLLIPHWYCPNMLTSLHRVIRPQYQHCMPTQSIPYCPYHPKHSSYFLYQTNLFITIYITTSYFALYITPPNISHFLYHPL